MIYIKVGTFSRVLNFVEAGTGGGVRVDAGVRLSLDTFNGPVGVTFFAVITVVILDTLDSVVNTRVFGTGTCGGLVAIGSNSFARSISRVGVRRVPVISHSATSHLTRQGLNRVSSLMSRFRVRSVCARVGCRNHPIHMAPLVCNSVVG